MTKATKAKKSKKQEAKFQLSKANGANRWRKVRKAGEKREKKRGNPVFGFRVDAGLMKAFVRKHKGQEGAIEAVRGFMSAQTGRVAQDAE
jgi:hypothetical protein